MPSDSISPTQARVYQINEYYRNIAALEAQTTAEPLKTLYQLLLQELHATLQEFHTA